MTVRVNKPPIDLRSKLSELERPIGVKGNELMRAETAQEARDLVSAGRKNMVINGDMSVSQRSTSFANPAATPNGFYTLDRFSFQANNTNYTVSQDSTGPDGFSRSLKVTMGTATTLDYMRLAATIEGYNFRGAKFGTPSAEHLTLSFWVKSSLTGTFAVGFRNGNSLTANLGTSLVTTYNIHNSNVWEYKTVLIPPNTNGSVSWNDDSVLGMVIMWDLGDGTGRCPSITSSINSVWQTADNYYPVGFDETVKLASTSSATWQITGVQLEVGKNATEFEHRSYGEELALCQRYFYINGGEQHDIISQAFSPHTTEIAIAWPHPVEMRATPTVTISSTNNNNTVFYFRPINNTGFALTGNGRSIAQMTKHHASIWFNSMSGVPAVPGQVRVQNARTAFIHLSAEL